MWFRFEIDDDDDDDGTCLGDKFIFATLHAGRAYGECEGHIWIGNASVCATHPLWVDWIAVYLV
jgi:hypothetical protein